MSSSRGARARESSPAGYGSGVVTYANRGLHGQLVESLGMRIVQGDFEPAEIIDVDALETDHDVSRTVVREAVKVLIGKGLIDARPKYGTFVRNRSEWNLLDPDVIRWRQADGADPRLLRELMEIRMVIEPRTARLAAMGGDPRHLGKLDEAFEAMAFGEDHESHIEADLIFHRALAAASGNELLERLIAMLEPVQRVRDELAYEADPEDTAYIDLHRAVYEAVRSGRPDDAEEAMQELLERANIDIEAAIGRTTE